MPQTPRWDDDDDITPATESAKPVEAPRFLIQEQPAETERRSPSVEEARREPPPPTFGMASDEDRLSAQSERDGDSGSRVEFGEVLSTRIGILGGREAGKSYFFQALVQSATGQGVLRRYLKGSRLEISKAEAISGQELASEDLETFRRQYLRWERLPSTALHNQMWYKLRVRFATGLLSGKQWNLDIDFLDGSGDVLTAGLGVPNMRRIWERAFADATIMVFCLPLWALFPANQEMTEGDWTQRERLLGGLSKLAGYYQEVRRVKDVRTFLALTMADDPRVELEALRRRWIDPLTKKKESRAGQMEKLQSCQGVPRYLASARQVSDYLYEQIAQSSDQRVQDIPVNLSFPKRPWLAPISAIDGAELKRIESERAAGRVHPQGSLPSPRPAHAELPLLAAMCDCQNALM